MPSGTPSPVPGPSGINTRNLQQQQQPMNEDEMLDRFCGQCNTFDCPLHVDHETIDGEVLEIDSKIHPFYVGTQAHPEFKSRPTRPHPLFARFIQAAVEVKARDDN